MNQIVLFYVFDQSCKRDLLMVDQIKKIYTYYFRRSETSQGFDNNMNCLLRQVHQDAVLSEFVEIHTNGDYNVIKFQLDAVYPLFFDIETNVDYRLDFFSSC